MPAGVVAGPVWQGIRRVAWPLLWYRLRPNPQRLQRVCDALFTDCDARWTAYFGDALFSYCMDIRVPPLASSDELNVYRGRVLVFGARNQRSS